MELVFYFNLGKLGRFSIELLVFTFIPCVHTIALMTPQVAGCLMNNNWGQRLVGC
jgi:hypothetical protein